MAVAAVNAEAGDMMLMAERHRLSPGYVLSRGIGGSIQHVGDPQHERDEEHRAEDAESRNRVGTRMENLHRFVDRNERRDTGGCLPALRQPRGQAGTSASWLLGNGAYAIS